MHGDSLHACSGRSTNSAQLALLRELEIRNVCCHCEPVRPIPDRDIRALGNCLRPPTHSAFYPWTQAPVSKMIAWNSFRFLLRLLAFIEEVAGHRRPSQ